MGNRKMTKSTLNKLDEHYAAALGCRPEDLRAGRLLVAASPHRDLRFAKGSPLPVFGLSTSQGAVVSVEPRLEEKARRALSSTSGFQLNDQICSALEEALQDWTIGAQWFRGVRLYLEEHQFVDLQQGDVQELDDTFEIARRKRERWGGPVFGQMVQGQPVSVVTVKPLSDVVWDLGVETDSRWRGKGHARSVASAAIRNILAQGRIPAWGTDRDNAASLAVARGLGFTEYGLEVGCWYPSLDTIASDG